MKTTRIIHVLTRDFPLIAAEAVGEGSATRMRESLGWGFSKRIFVLDKGVWKCCFIEEEFVKGLKEFLLASEPRALERAMEKCERECRAFRAFAASHPQPILSSLGSRDLARVTKKFFELAAAFSSKYYVVLKLPDTLAGTALKPSWRRAFEKALRVRKATDGVFEDCFAFARTILREVSHRSRIPRELLEHATVKELTQFLERGKALDQSVLKKRAGGMVFVAGAKPVVASGDPERELKKMGFAFGEAVDYSKITVVRGMPAFHGKTIGRARIAVRTVDLAKVQDGDVLVAPMTTPDFLPAMKRASAFVTDEGGVTCHAAIVAREFKKPCVIGTKMATKVFKDGDLVEVDGVNGLVKKL